MKHALPQAILVLAAAGIPAGASAQAISREPAYPTKSIRLVVPFAPGGVADLQGRMLAEKLKDRLGRPIVIDNRAGANGIIGMEIVARAPAAFMTRIKLTPVPYKGAAPALIDLVGGHIHVLFGSAIAAIPHIQSGRVRALATTGARRVAALPDLPTIAEAGVPGYENTVWSAIGAPARTPQAIVARLNGEIAAILQMPETQERFAAGGSTINGGTPEQFRDHLKSELAKFKKLVNETGIKPEQG